MDMEVMSLIVPITLAVYFLVLGGIVLYHYIKWRKQRKKKLKKYYQDLYEKNLDDDEHTREY